RATLKVEGVLKEAEKIRDQIESASEKHADKYSDEDKQQDLKVSRVQVAIGIAKLYAPAVLVGAAGLGLMIGSNVVLTKRNAGLTAAYAALDKMFKGYRARVVADAGEEKDREYLYDLVDKE